MSPINFFKGYASNSLFPKEELANAYKEVLVNTDYNKYDVDINNQNPLNYGTDPGNDEIRSTISQWLSKRFNRVPSNKDCFNLTNGASFGIGVITNMCTDRQYTERVFIVSPCYYLINSSFIDAGFDGKTTAIKETPEAKYSIDIEELETQLKQLGSRPSPTISDPCGRPNKRVYKSLIYIVPTYSNPGSITYSMETRLKLLELARKYDMLIISDDVYDVLNYSLTTPTTRMCYLDADTLSEGDGYGHTISNASTSKLLAPGLRFGWQETPTPKLAIQLSQHGNTKSGGCPSQLSSFTVDHLMKTGSLDTIINNFISHYSKRAQVVKQCIEEYFPKSTTWYGGEGGYFFWITFHDDIDVGEIISILNRDYDIIIAPGTAFEVTNNVLGWNNSVRISVSFLDKESIAEGMKIWGDLMREKYPSLY